MKLDEYEEFEKKYDKIEEDTQYTSVFQKLPFVNTKLNMDVLSIFDTNAFARIDSYLAVHLQQSPCK